MRNSKILKIISVLFTFSILILMLTSSSFATENAKVFMTDYFSTASSDTAHAQNGFNKLNYNYSTTSSVTKSQILAWTNSGGSSYSNSNYAFYISTHGPTDSAAASGTTYFLDNNGNTITPGEITGNWHLVYIDACNSKRNSNFPNSLNITSSYSNRGYLGWATEVGVSSANSFNNYFWETYVTHYSIRNAAVKAAADVPGSGTTPIRFVGDTSWYGYST